VVILQDNTFRRGRTLYNLVNAGGPQSFTAKTTGDGYNGTSGYDENVTVNDGTSFTLSWVMGNIGRYRLCSASGSSADNAPTMHQVNEAVETGHLDQAQRMMDQVLIDHPKSAAAHYLQAQLYSKEGKVAAARSELGVAETLEPGLPHVAPESVEALKSELGLRR
jgi:hypothetical protein